MRLHQYFIVLIFTLCLILNTFNAQVDAIKLSAIYKGNSCTSTQKINPSSIPPTAGGAAPDDNTLKCVVAEPYNGTFTIECKPDVPLPSNLTLAWFKDTSVVQQNERIKIRGSNSLILEFIPIIPDDAGLYLCKAVKKDENPSLISPEKTLAIEVKVLPYVKSAHKDVTFVEEKPINLTCVVLSKTPNTVTWFVRTLEGQRNYSASEGRVILSTINSTVNAMLHIKSANLSLDRGTFVCIAKSDVGVSPTNSTIMVRIKGKYAALWPFLGICAEVIILGAIILIYEKKRDKSEMEESDTDQGPETKSSPDHGQDGVRYRK